MCRGCFQLKDEPAPLERQGNFPKLPNKSGLAGLCSATYLGMLREGTCSEGPWVQKQLSDYIKEVKHFPTLQAWR